MACTPPATPAKMPASTKAISLVSTGLMPAADALLVVVAATAEMARPVRAMRRLWTTNTAPARITSASR